MRRASPQSDCVYIKNSHLCLAIATWMPIARIRRLCLLTYIKLKDIQSLHTPAYTSSSLWESWTLLAGCRLLSQRLHVQHTQTHDISVSLTAYESSNLQYHDIGLVSDIHTRLEYLDDALSTYINYSPTASAGTTAVMTTR